MHDKLPIAYAGRRSTMGCPHCGTVLKIRSSRQTDMIVRQMTLACQNDDCCATFGGDLTLTHVISSGAKPNPAVRLRTTPPRRRPANDDVPAKHESPTLPPPPANDDGADQVSN
jgi:hypothetical protein